MTCPSDLPTSRAQAIRGRSHLYTTGKPCLRGHFAGRYTLTGNCSECMKRRVDIERNAIRTALGRPVCGEVDHVS